ncbi:MAG: hypothetical protein F6J92_33980, partial [Symploca sp. SIO1A3]|nr:hypothetical protein [Symploca sp. SIO1A3]
ETEYFYFLTSDDTCFPTLVSTTTKALDAHPDIDACHFEFAFINREGTIINPPAGLVNHCDLYFDYNKYAHRRSGICEFMMHFVYWAVYLTITSLVFRRQLITKMKGFPTKYGSVGDYDWTMRLGLFTDVLYLPKLLATWRLYEEQATAQTNLLQRQEKCMAIAQANLDYLVETEQSRILKKNINKHQVLAYIADGYASTSYRQILASKKTNEMAQKLFDFLQKYPEYALKKTLNRLSANRLYPYRPRGEVAQELINDYGLKWPPIRLSN